MIQGSRNSYNATVVDAENNEYTLIIWSNKVNELKSRGIFEDLLKASQLRQKFTVKGTLQIYGPKREEQIIFEEVFVKMNKKLKNSVIDFSFYTKKLYEIIEDIEFGVIPNEKELEHIFQK